MKRPLLALIGFAVVGLLAACGGGGGGNGGTSQPQGDQFTVAVQSIVASSPDDAEPQSVDAVTLTTPDDQEPVPVS